MTLFTLPEAEEMLPRVRDELVAMRDAKRELDELRAELAQLGKRAAGNGHVVPSADVTPKRRRAETLAERLNAGLARFTEWGIELKGLEEGLVDFPSDREGRVVYLCWRLGEDRIAWWHEMDTGFAGRQPL